MSDTTIDQVSEDKNGNVILSLRQTEPWDKSQVLEQFQKRLNGYIDVLTHGALYKKYPDLTGKPVRIRLICYYAPPESMRSKLDRVNQTLAALSIGFEITQIEVADPAKRRDTIKDFIVSLYQRFRGKD